MGDKKTYLDDFVVEGILSGRFLGVIRQRMEHIVEHVAGVVKKTTWRPVRRHMPSVDIIRVCKVKKNKVVPKILRPPQRGRRVEMRYGAGHRFTSFGCCVRAPHTDTFTPAARAPSSELDGGERSCT